MRIYIAAATIWLAIMGGPVWAAAPQSPNNVLTLDRALELALEHNAGLHAARYDLQAADGRLRQAHVWPNPALMAEVENFGGAGDLRGFDSAETTVSLEQRLEIGGQRGIRRRRATVERELFETDLESWRRDVVRDTRQSFARALAAQARVALRSEALQLAQQMARASSLRVATGKDAPVALAQARAELARAQINLDRACGEHAISYRALAAIWGETPPGFETVAGNLAAGLEVLPDSVKLSRTLRKTPGWTRWEQAIRAAELEVRAAYASRIPDLTVGFGIRQFQADSASALVAGVGLDIPIFDRRRGTIVAARAGLDRARTEQAAAWTALQTEFGVTREILTVARESALMIERQALPAAQEAFQAAETAYLAGKIGYLEALDARRSLIELRGELIDVLAEYQCAAAALESIVDRDVRGENGDGERIN